MNQWKRFRLFLSAGLVFALCADLRGDQYVTPQSHPAFARPKFISTPLDKAYPGLEYNIRPAIKGGYYPYTFTLTKSPAGMKIDPARGTITWIAPEEEDTKHEVVLKVTDAKGQTASQAFQVLVSAKGFYFISPSGSDAGGDGSISKPWRSVQKANRPSVGFVYPPGAVIYARGGLYGPREKFEVGKKNINLIRLDKKSPARWIAYPGEKPVVDFGWSAEKRAAVWRHILKTNVRRKAEGKRPLPLATSEYGHRFLVNGRDGLYFDGFEIRNTCLNTFLIWTVSNATWRRCNFNRLYSDHRDNASFITTRTSRRRFHPNLVIQDNYFHDHFYKRNERAAGLYGGAMVFYSVKDSVIEDNRIEAFRRGWAVADKDSGWGNTYRNNRIRGQMIVANQGFSKEIEICYNVIEGGVGVGLQPGWVKNVWIHHNTIRGMVGLLWGGVSTPPGDRLANDPAYRKADSDASRRVIKAAKPQAAWINFYRNILVPSDDDNRYRFIMANLSRPGVFADKFRYVNWDDNLIDSRSVTCISWRKKRPWSLMTKAGFDTRSIFTKVKLNADHELAPGSIYLGKYGHQLPSKSER